MPWSWGRPWGREAGTRGSWVGEAASRKDTVHLPQVNSDGSWADSGQSNNSSYSPGPQLSQSFLPVIPWRPPCANGLPLIASPCLLSSPCWLTLSCPHIFMKLSSKSQLLPFPARTQTDRVGQNQGSLRRPLGPIQRATGSLKVIKPIYHHWPWEYLGTIGPQCLLARINFSLEDHLLKPYCCPVLVMLIIGVGVLSTLENSDLKKNSGLFLYLC